MEWIAARSFEFDAGANARECLGVAQRARLLGPGNPLSSMYGRVERTADLPRDPMS